MHKIYLIGEHILPDEGFVNVLSDEGFSIRRFKTLSLSMPHIKDASLVLTGNGQSSDPLFRDFLKYSCTIPKVVIDKDARPGSFTRWLNNKHRSTYCTVSPSNRELLFLLKKALSDSLVYKEFEQTRNNLSNAERELSLIEEVSKALTSSLDLHTIIDTIMKHIMGATRANGWSLYLLDEETMSLYRDKTRKRQTHYQILPDPGKGIAGWVASEGVPVIIPDLNSDAKFSPAGDEDGKHSIICVPLKSKGLVLGVLEIFSRTKGRPFTKDDLNITLKLVDLASLAIERASLYQKMAELAITDDLTKLFNSRYLNRTIETEILRCNRYKGSVSLIFLDIDYFKTVNDRYGHVVGSKLLVELGQLLIRGLRTIDIVSRYGGDEFVIVLPQTPPQIAAQIAERLRKSINKNTFLKEEGLNLKLTASFGVASYPETARNKEDLLRLADEAMYRVKNRTRDGVYSISLSN